MERTLRVLVLSHMYPRSSSPTDGIFVHEQVKALRERGIDARVQSGAPAWIDPLAPAASWDRLRARRAPAKWEHFEGVPWIDFRYPLPRGLWRWTAGFAYERAARRVAHEVAESFPFDVVHAHTALLDGSAAARIASDRGVPMALTEHTGPFSTLLRNRVSRRRTVRALAAADRILPVSRSLQQAMTAAIGTEHLERFEVLGNGVDGALFEPAPKPATDDTIRVLWVGHLVAVKRVLLLLDAFARARHEEPRLRLQLVGSGPLESAVTARVGALGLAEAVERRPLATRAGVAEAMRASDFLVLSSEVETFGLVVAEAMACGVPVLATRCGGPEELIVDDRLGRLVDGTPEALASGLLHLARHRDCYDRRAIREHALARHAHPVIAARLETIYEELAGGG